MINPRLESLFFAVIVLFSVSVSRNLTEPPLKLADSIQTTSLAVSASAISLGASQVEPINHSRGPNSTQSPINKNQKKQATEPTLKATEYLAKTLDGDSKILLERRRGGRWPIASITKLMTAVVAREKIPAETIVGISAAAASTEGQAGGIMSGEEFTRDDLIKAMLMVSSNDAAEALAEYYGREAYIQAMQAKAKELKMSDTTFGDPTGLSYLNQSTPEDLEKLALYILAIHPQIFTTSTELQSDILDLKSGSKRHLVNINSLSSQSAFLGGKTGFTAEAAGNLLSLFRFGNDRLLIIVFGSDDRVGDTLKIYDYLTSR